MSIVSQLDNDFLDVSQPNFTILYSIDFRLHRLKSRIGLHFEPHSLFKPKSAKFVEYCHFNKIFIKNICKFLAVVGVHRKLGFPIMYIIRNNCIATIISSPPSINKWAILLK